MHFACKCDGREAELQFDIYSLRCRKPSYTNPAYGRKLRPKYRSKAQAKWLWVLHIRESYCISLFQFTCALSGCTNCRHPCGGLCSHTCY